MEINKYKIKIPNYTNILYNKKKNILTVLGPLAKKSIKLKLILRSVPSKNILEVTNNLISSFNSIEQKNITVFQGTTVALIKQTILETSTVLVNKLKMEGVGYRTFDVEKFEKNLLMFKLGYSHPIFFLIPKAIKIKCLKLTKLFVIGYDYQHVTQVASIIQSYKKPEPYKGKGILYDNQKIQLKEGKKI
jgi:large subunit ribosomal protein L6